VAPEWIVTAAHCAYGAPGKFADSMTAILNAKDYTDRATREVIGIDRLVVHQAYDPARTSTTSPSSTSAARRPPGDPLATKDEHAAHRYISYVDEPNAAAGAAPTRAAPSIRRSSSRRTCASTRPPSAASSPALTRTRRSARNRGQGRRVPRRQRRPAGRVRRDDARAVLWGITSYGPQSVAKLDPCSTLLPVVFSWVPAFARLHPLAGGRAGRGRPGPASAPPARPPPPTASCIAARKKLAPAKKAENRALKHLRALRRAHAGRKAERRASKRYHDLRTKRIRISASIGRFCA
jgi:hypothetical protein